MALAVAALGACGDVLMSLAAAPLDRVTLVMQTQSLPASARHGALAEGLKDCADKLRETGGLLALWRGSSAEVGKSYAVVLTQVGLRLLNGPKQPTPGKRRAVAHAVQSAIALAAAYPLTLARVRLSVNADATDSVLQTWKRVVARADWGSLYAGLKAELAADALMRGVFYVTYAAARHLVLDRDADESPLCRFAAVQAAGALALCVAHPIRTVQARMAVVAGSEDEYSDPRDCAKALYDAEGVAGFYHGFLPAWLSQTIKNGVLLNGVCYVASHWLQLEPEVIATRAEMEACAS